MVLLRSESPIGKCAKFHTVAESNNRDHVPRSLLLVRTTYICRVILRAHPLRGESHIQRNAIREVATVRKMYI